MSEMWKIGLLKNPRKMTLFEILEMFRERRKQYPSALFENQKILKLFTSGPPQDLSYLKKQGTKILVIFRLYTLKKSLSNQLNICKQCIDFKVRYRKMTSRVK